MSHKTRDDKPSPVEALMDAFGDRAGVAMVASYRAALDVLDNPDSTDAARDRAVTIAGNLEAAARSIRLAESVRTRLTGQDVLQFLGAILPRLAHAADSDSADQNRT